MNSGPEQWEEFVPDTVDLANSLWLVRSWNLEEDPWVQFPKPT